MSLNARQEMLVSIQKNYKTADPKLKKKIMEGFLAAYTVLTVLVLLTSISIYLSVIAFEL